MTIDIIGSRPSETAANAADFMTNNHYTYPVLLDEKFATTRMYNVASTPTNFILDKNGVIQERQTGAFEEAAFTEIVDRLNAQ